MPTWSEIVQEYQTLLVQHKTAAIDIIRRKYISEITRITKRETILYASRFVQGDLPVEEQGLIMITDDDLQAFMEVVHGMKGKHLNLILHSPGGVPETAEAIVSYLREKFDDVTIFVPTLAMSAATMMACSGNRITLGKHSFLGPIDPQLRINTQLGIQFAPAQAVLDQFERAKRECQNHKHLAAWLPMLGQYGPYLLETCENVLKLSEVMVANWIHDYMFSGKDRRKANRIGRWLRDHKHFKSHNRHISRAEAEEAGLVIEKLESNQALQDAVLSVFHTTVLTFNLTAAAKITENNLGRAYIKFSPSVMKRFQNLSNNDGTDEMAKAGVIQLVK